MCFHVIVVLIKSDPSLRKKNAFFISCPILSIFTTKVGFSSISSLDLSQSFKQNSKMKLFVVIFVSIFLPHGFSDDTSSKE